MSLRVAVAGLFSLIANYRIERSLRRAYLLAAKDRRRLTVLAAESEGFAALSQTDRLTGLANPMQLDLRSAALFDNPSNAGLQVGLLMIDVDYFKRYNDQYGHVAGDACLRPIAGILAETVAGKGALAVRYGGEQVVVLLPSVPAGRIGPIAQSIRHAVAERGLEHANREDGVGIVTVSIS